MAIILFKSVMRVITKVETPAPYALETLSRQKLEMHKTVMQMNHVME